jgi:hypothetical protein
MPVTPNNTIIVLCFLAFLPYCIAMFRSHRKPTAMMLLCVMSVGALIVYGSLPVASVIWVFAMYWSLTSNTFQTPAR